MAEASWHQQEAAGHVASEPRSTEKRRLTLNLLSPFFPFLQSGTQNRVVLPTFRVGDQDVYKSSQVDNEDKSPLISQQHGAGIRSLTHEPLINIADPNCSYHIIYMCVCVNKFCVSLVLSPSPSLHFITSRR